MFRYLKIKKKPDKVNVHPGALTTQWLREDAYLPISLSSLNKLPDEAKKRLYRTLIPPALLDKFNIDPVRWEGQGDFQITLRANPQAAEVVVCINNTAKARREELFCLHLTDNAFNSIDLNFIIIKDPASERFDVDYDEKGQPTLFGKARRNRVAEEKAMLAGLAPGQERRGLTTSRMVLQQVEAFLATCGHRSYTVEPLSYASAWLFEKNGFAYQWGHKLMNDIHREFQPGGKLYEALDNSTPFRRPKQWSTVRGRSWAIHDGLLDAIDAKWDTLRMIKQVGRHACVETSPDTVY